MQAVAPRKTAGGRDELLASAERQLSKMQQDESVPRLYREVGEEPHASV